MFKINSKKNEAIKELTSPNKVEELEKELKKENGIQDDNNKEDKSSDMVDQIKEMNKELEQTIGNPNELVTKEDIEKKLTELEQKEDEIEKKIKKLEETVKKRVPSGLYYNMWN